jgi:protein involved in polysaccharide export with SLBB domain
MIAPTRLLLPTLLLLGACATVKKYTPDLSRVPKPPLPSFAGLKKLTRVLPGMPDSDSTGADDPKLPFEAGQKLGHGHSLRLHVYEGARSTKRIYNGVVMVDADGLINLQEAGSARVGGLDLVEATGTIARTFRLGLRLTRPVTVHVLSVEDVPLVAVTGDIARPRYLPAWEGMTLSQAVAQAGGRRSGSSNRGIYLVREGLSRYYADLETADAKMTPEPGDILQLSTDF